MRQHILLARIITLVVAGGLLTACAQSQNAPKQTGGALIGAAAGGLLGSQFGGGAGALAATAIGVLGGAFLGSEIGKSMDTTDRQEAARTQNVALESNRTGVASTWSNPDTGNTGTITPIRTYQASSGQNCREYRHDVRIGDKSETVIGTACRQADGTWKVVSDGTT
jgi:surface antigen